MVLNFGLGLGGNLFPSSAAEGQGMEATVTSQIIWKDVGIGIVPIGSVVAWVPELFDSKPPLLPNYVECNGQVLSDGDSPLDGKTIPDLNGSVGTPRFLKGDTTSGTLGGSGSHTHTLSGSGSSHGLGGSGFFAVSSSGTSASGPHEPKNYTVVWVMRIK